MFPDPAGQESGTIPTAPRKRGSKRRIAADGRGIPITIAVTGINRHDSIALQSTPAAIPVVPAPMAKRTHAPAGCRRTSAMTSHAVVHYPKPRHTGIAHRQEDGRERLGRYR